MSTGLQLVLAALGSALLGSIPFSLLIARFAGGIDLRKVGSGNVGATNVARTLGWKWGTLALLCDAAKGVVPVLLFPALMTTASPGLDNERVLCGVCAILGHMFPPWLGFKGGKGVATALGVVTVLAPAGTGIACLAFIVTFALSRIVSLSSIVAALSYAIAEVVLHGSDLWGPQTWGLGAFAIAIPLLIIYRHRTNIVRLWHGQEPRLQLKKKTGEPEV
ncbi:glycerol-3-phosphate 1-O-acyltransferase PlsY [Planctomicrobium piriforme]|uniref:Glycerol-3-phosphate acyltransferase n=1 Tax=Planctomicrobium piriforme TaxID=1576369 RepID=A0A1I3BG32_9PLAN|nr:glycerol-3-phosphate 1-O-acyltransferase PlsY [Planctomicrobium piriforme]SFH61254.1 glycerol-3-phosphate acyltransferase PlsY [Planctomicrobium piriforme]